MNQFIVIMARLKATTLFFSTLLFIFLSTNAHAQIGKRIKERIKENTERKVEDKIVNKAGQKTDQALDSLFKTRKRPGRSSTKKSSPESGNNSGNGSSSEGKSSGGGSEAPEMSGFDLNGMLNAKYDDSYTLDMEFEIEIKSREKKKKKEEVVMMNMHYGKTCYMMVVPDEDGNDVPMKTLMDLKNNSSLMLNDEDKTGMAISMDFVTDKIGEAVENSQDSTDANYTFKKTGKTKMIAGYSCEEYLIDTDESTMTIWYTDEISPEIHENMGEFAMFGSFSGAMANAPQGQKVGGMMMESHMVEKAEKGGTFDYVVKEVNLVPTTINISDYKMGMGGM